MRRVLGLLPALLLAGCIHFNETPLAPNVVRLDTQASGSLFVGATGQATLKRAAEITAARGFTHFRLEQASTGQGAMYVGSSTNTYGNVYGGGFTATTFSTPTYAPTASVGVTVVMFKGPQPGAFEAADVIKKQGKV